MLIFPIKFNLFMHKKSIMIPPKNKIVKLDFAIKYNNFYIKICEIIC